mgnify:FL=1
MAQLRESKDPLREAAAPLQEIIGPQQAAGALKGAAAHLQMDAKAQRAAKPPSQQHF